MNFVQFLFQDFFVNKDNTKGKIIAFFFRIANYSSYQPKLKFIFYPYLIFYKILFEWILGFELPYNTKIGKGLKFFHIQSIVINSGSIIGKNCSLRHNLTIGNSNANGQCPRVGDEVNIGANVCIIGNILIGDNVTIGAGSVVVKDVPSNCTIVGNPAKIIKKNNINA